MTDTLTPERLAEIRNVNNGTSAPYGVLAYSYISDLLSHIDAQAAELRQVDNVLARRPALDDLPNRVDKISHAISTAGKVEAQALEIERLRADKQASDYFAGKFQDEAEAAKQELAERYEDDVPKHVAWDVLVKRTAELTRYKAVVEECAATFTVSDGTSINWEGLAREFNRRQQIATTALEDGKDETWVCVNGHDRCAEMSPGPNCPYCERKPT